MEFFDDCEARAATNYLTEFAEECTALSTEMPPVDDSMKLIDRQLGCMFPDIWRQSCQAHIDKWMEPRSPHHYPVQPQLYGF